MNEIIINSLLYSVKDECILNIPIQTIIEMNVLNIYFLMQPAVFLVSSTIKSRFIQKLSISLKCIMYIILQLTNLLYETIKCADINLYFYFFSESIIQQIALVSIVASSRKLTCSLLD